jgi:hypothetical protein
MTMENPREDLVGPRNEDVVERVPEDTTVDGKPIWMAFLEDPEAINLSKEETEAAKNALNNAPADVVDMCRRVPLNECIEKVSKAA